MGGRRRHELLAELARGAQLFTAAASEVLERRALAEAAGRPISVTEWKLLRWVAVTEHHALADVAALLGISNAAASRAVDKLVRRALLKRSESAADRRVMELSLTPAAVRLLKSVEEARTARLKQAARFAPEDTVRASELLERAAAVLLHQSGAGQGLCLRCGIYFRPECLLRTLVPVTCFYESRGLRSAAGEGGAQ